MFQLEESEGSRSGATYIGAAKGVPPIVNEGQRTIKFHTDCGEKRKVTCQVARVNNILASIAGICDNGSQVIVNWDGGEIVNLKTGKRTPFRRHGNIYVLDAWILNPDYKDDGDDAAVEVMDFNRQGEVR